ncbi:MAG TPA: MoxR family ATPase [Aggregatilineales bacterium]|nr:MoxR family ATPase [Aggregatilineales bacterium]
MNVVTQKQLIAFLWAVAPARPVFIWGPPGVGKSSLVEQFAAEHDLPCISLLGSQLAPEDLIGVPQIFDGKSRFCPPDIIARSEPYVLFLDELNASAPEVQKAFYSLIHERRLANYRLPAGSMVIGAGNRAQDRAITRPMASALMNRMLHIELRASVTDWLDWAESMPLHPFVIDYIRMRPDHLTDVPPETEAPFSTPRAWHMLSDALYGFGERMSPEDVALAAAACLSVPHASQFVAFVKQKLIVYRPELLLNGAQSLPTHDRDLMYFVIMALHGYLLEHLPRERRLLTMNGKTLVAQAQGLIRTLMTFDGELVQLLLGQADPTSALPGWFVADLATAIPARLMDGPGEKEKIAS